MTANRIVFSFSSQPASQRERTASSQQGEGPSAEEGPCSNPSLRSILSCPRVSMVSMASTPLPCSCTYTLHRLPSAAGNLQPLASASASGTLARPPMGKRERKSTYCCTNPSPRTTTYSSTTHYLLVRSSGPGCPSRCLFRAARVHCSLVALPPQSTSPSTQRPISRPAC